MAVELTPEQQAIQDRIDQLVPLRAIADGEAFAAIAAALTALRGAFIDDRALFAHVDGLAQIMPALRLALSKEPTEVPASAPEILPPA